MRAWFERHREELYDYGFALVLVLSLIIAAIAMVVLFTVSTPAHANICERYHMQKVITRGGRSWRCRHVRPQMRREKVTPPVPRSRPGTVLAPQTVEVAAAVPLVRAVRVIPIFNGLTVRERIERAFDKLVIFPVEDEP